MKRIIIYLSTALSVALFLLGAFPATAQQLPNSGFEGSWKTCTPWTNGNGNKTIGENPESWCISHVMGITSGLLAGTGKKAMGEKISGFNSSNAVKVYNDETGAAGITRVVPGYLTTGTSWSTAEGTNSSTHDGGTWGGISFSFRPDAISFYYQRTLVTGSNEKASFIAYLWKGSWSQASVPVTITMSGAAKKIDQMINRDRSVLKLDDYTTGGSVSQSNDAELIALFNLTEDGSTDAWTHKIIELEYLSDAGPSMFNIIFSANNYFDKASATKGNTLSIDDVRLIYYSRLKSLNFNNKPLEGFDSKVTDYSFNVETLPQSSDFSYEVLTTSGSSSAKLNMIKDTPTERIFTITVTNSNGSGAGFEDEDGLTSHTYTLTFKLKIDLLSLKVNNVDIDLPSELTDAIPANQPFTDKIELTSNVADPVIALGERAGTNDNPTRTLTIAHPDDNSVSNTYTLSFLPYKAEIMSVKLAKTGNIVTPDPQGIIKVEYRYSVAGGIAENGVTYALSSGEPKYTCSDIIEPDLNPHIDVTVTNSDGFAPITNKYTIVYNPPISSRISGVKIGNTTYPVGEGSNVIDLTGLMPLPTVSEITPEYILPDNNQSATISIDTETGTGKIVVSNKSNDYDGKNSHEYTLKLAPVSISRPKSISIDGSEFDPAFDSKTYSYKVRGFMPDNDAIKFDWFKDALTPTFNRIGEPTDAEPKIEITFASTDGGKDFDGLTSHTYTLTFNQRPNEFRSNYLSDITINGVSIDNFDYATTTYSIPTPVVSTDAIGYTVREYDNHPSTSTTVSKSLDENKAVITLTVRGEYANSDGRQERTYTLQFLPYYSRIKSITAPDGSDVATFDKLGENISVSVPGQIPKLPNTVQSITESLKFESPTAGKTKYSVSADDIDAATATVTVSNEKPDVDGLSSRTYTLTYDRPYYSRLNGVSVNGVAIENFDRNKFEYSLSSQMPANENDITCQLIQNSNNLGSYRISKTLDAESAKATILVSNSEPDVDGLSEHTYTLQFDLPYFSRIESLRIGGVTVADVPQDGATPMIAAMQLPADDEAAKALFSPTFKQGSGSPSAAYTFDRVNSTATLIVTNGGKKDIDGKSEHKYIVQFEPPYLSRAASITVGGVAVSGFNSAVTEYTLGGQMPAKDDIAVTYQPGNGSCSHVIDTDAESATVTVTITNTGDGSGNYASSTVYTLHFDKPYFSRLASLSIKGTAVSGFDKDKFDYTLPGIAPKADEINATAMRGSGSVNISKNVDTEQGVVTIQVSNSGGNDLDGLSSHTYTLHFDKPVNSRLASISIKGTPLADFDADTYIYNIRDMEMPAQGEVTYTLGSQAATASVSYDAEAGRVTISVSAQAPDIDGLSTHTYTLNFKKSTPVDPAPGGQKSVYEGTLIIMMMGEDITGGGQAAKVEITQGSDGTCTFLLPDFSLDLGDGPASLGDIKVENVAMTPDGNGGYSYSGQVNGMELAGGEIVADVTLNGTTDAAGKARMTIAVLWEGIAIDVEFNGECTSTEGPVVPEPPTDDWSEFEGSLSIEMMGSYIAEGQPATVLITDAVEGKCNFKLPDFTLDLDGQLLTLGDIVVNNVDVAEANGVSTYTGFVAGMSFLDGEIIADINLNGTVDESGNARMTIQVLWKQDGEDIPINVEFNGKRTSIDWMNIDGNLTIALNGYDLTEGGKSATIKIACTGENGEYTMLLPDFSLALDSESSPAELGDIRIDNVAMTACDGYDRYTGRASGMKLAGGEIVADITVDGSISSDNEVRVNVDVVWIMADGQRVPILVKFTNMNDAPAAAERKAYTGKLTTESDGMVYEHNVTVFLTPVYGNRADLRIEGIDFAAASRAAELGNSITVPSVSITSMANGIKAYDGAAIGSKVREDMTLDITLHGYSDLSNRFTAELGMEWIEKGIKLTGTFTGDEDTSGITGIPAGGMDEGKAEYFDLRGVRVDGSNLRPGIYIRRCGNKSEKILVK